MDTPPNLNDVVDVVDFAVDRGTRFANARDRTNVPRLAVTAAHGIVEVVVRQFSRTVIDHADAHHFGFAFIGVLVGRIRHEGFPFTVGKHHGAKHVAFARCRGRARSTTVAGDLHSAAVRRTSATIGQGLPASADILDTVAGVTNARFGVRDSPRTARASAIEAVDEVVRTSAKLDVQVASGDTHNRTRSSGGFTVAATVAVREGRSRHDVGIGIAPNDVTAAHRVAIVDLCIHTGEG